MLPIRVAVCENIKSVCPFKTIEIMMKLTMLNLIKLRLKARELQLYRLAEMQKSQL